MLSGIGGELRTVTLTLYTDTHIVRATYATRQRRVTDILNEPDTDFIVVRDAVFDDFGTTTSPVRAEYAQLNLGAVLFAVADETVDAVPELRTPKVAEKALISIPPFKAVGNIHLLPERNLQESLEELIGRFLPVTDAEYWSDRVGEARQQATMIAVNHARAQIMAPHREADPWAGPGSRRRSFGRAGAGIRRVGGRHDPCRRRQRRWLARLRLRPLAPRAGPSAPPADRAGCPTPPSRRRRPPRRRGRAGSG